NVTSLDNRLELLVHTRSPEPVERPIENQEQSPLGFSYTLLDRSDGRLLWSRNSAAYPPDAVWIHTDSCMVTCDSWLNFTAFDRVTGECVISTCRFDLFPPEDWGTPGRLDSWPAGPVLAKRGRFVFFEHDASTYFGCRTDWGREFVFDFDGRRVITSPS